MPKRSAGLLVYRDRNRGPDHGQGRGPDNGRDTDLESELEVFLVHPGGPLWAKRDRGSWSIPKGEYDAAEPPLQAAIREFGEETGFSVGGDFIDLGVIRQAGGKLVSAWGCDGDFDAAQLISNECEIEWPPRSGRRILIPEVDRGAWFDLAEARARILESQREFLDRLRDRLPAWPARK